MQSIPATSKQYKHCFARPIRLVRWDSTSSGGWSDEESPAARSRYLELLESELQRFNNAVERLGLPAIVLPRRGRLVS